MSDTVWKEIKGKVAPKSTGSSQRILLVEDEDILRKTLSQMLDLHGFEVKSCSNGKEALEVFTNTKNKFDIIVSDIKMPKMNGIEFYEKIKNIYSNLFVFITGNPGYITDLKEIIDANERVKLLSKPFEIAVLLQILGKE